MLLKKLNEQLVNILSAHVPQGEVLTDTIMNVLNIERKTAYRRVSGQTPFSLLETVTLANHFGFSLDELSTNTNTQKVVFELGLLSDKFNYVSNSKQEYYIKIMSKLFFQHYVRISHFPESSVSGAHKMVPPMFYLKYESLAKFSIIKWSHRFLTENNSLSKYDDVIIPEKMRAEQLQLVSQHRKIANTTMILDHLAFQNLIIEIEYYFKMGILTDANIVEIKTDLFAMLKDLKNISSPEKNENENNIDLYISNIHFESSLFYFESPISTHAILTVFYINFITTKDKYMIEVLKDWIKTLKKNSTLISGASDIFKYNYFSDQEKLINGLDDLTKR